MTAPASPFTNNDGIAQPFEVWIGDQNDDEPTEVDVNEEYRVVSVTRSAGGHRLDHANLQYDLGDAQVDLVDWETPTNQSVKCEVHLVDPAGGDSGGCVFSGEFGISTIRIDRGESLNLQARIEPWHFGDPLLGPHVLDVDEETVLTPHAKIIFQPEIDGVICDNMCGFVGTEYPTSAAGNYALWVDPEAVRTKNAKDSKSIFPLPWTLSRAVHSLCWACNPDETFIVNPTIDELRQIFEPPDPLPDEESDEEQQADEPDDSDENQPEDDAEPAPETPPAQLLPAESPKGQSAALRNIELPRGKRLPQLLDELLPRFGYNWFVQPVTEETDAEGAALDPPIVRNHIRVFELGKGNEVQLFLQRPATPAPALNTAKSNVPDLDVELNWADVANEIVGQGTLEEWEATFELYRGWKEDEDDLTPDQLRMVDDGKDVSDSESVFKQHPNAWRKWVLNEAGDYCETRVALLDASAPIPNVPFDLKPLLGPNTEAKRRRFHHCLTKDLMGERRDVYLQYRDLTVPDDDDPLAWKSVPREGAEAWTNAGFHVLEKECGIYFSGSTPPEALMIDLEESPGKARLRITACIRGDDRLQYTAVRQAQSPNANTIKLFVDLSHRFHSRSILSADIPPINPEEPTIYASALLKETYGDYTVDDTQLLTDYCNELRTLEQAARLSCEFEVAGIQTAYQIGQLVTKINGRNISFNRNSPEQAEKLYPQITAITFDRKRQRTRLRVETFDFTPAKLKKLSL
jgi:hypothetical protein